MCDKCVELDRKIERYRSLIAKVPDPLTAERVGELIKEMHAQKVHSYIPGRKSKAASVGGLFHSNVMSISDLFLSRAGYWAFPSRLRDNGSL